MTAAAVGLGTACFLLVNLGAVERAMSRAPTPDDASSARSCGRTAGCSSRRSPSAGGFIALELRPADAWQTLLVWTHRSDFGVEDPLFHRDVGFFVFSLPLYQQVARWLLETIVMAGAASLAAYAAAGAFRKGRRRAALRAARHACARAGRLAARGPRVAVPARAVRARAAARPGRVRARRTPTCTVRLPALRVAHGPGAGGRGRLPVRIRAAGAGRRGRRARAGHAGHVRRAERPAGARPALRRPAAGALARAAARRRRHRVHAPRVRARPRRRCARCRPARRSPRRRSRARGGRSRTCRSGTRTCCGRR